MCIRDSRKGFYVLYRLPTGDNGVVVVDVNELISVISHSKLLHICELAQAVAGFHPLHKSLVLLGLHGVNQIHAGLIHGKDVQRGEYADVGRNDGLGGRSLAVAGH